MDAVMTVALTQHVVMGLAHTVQALAHHPFNMTLWLATAGLHEAAEQVDETERVSGVRRVYYMLFRRAACGGQPAVIEAAKITGQALLDGGHEL